MSKHGLIGVIVVILGIWFLMGVLSFATGGLIAPLIFFFLGYYFYQNKRKLIAAIFFIISGSILLDQLFSINFIGLILAVICFYYGLKLVKSQKKTKKSHAEREQRLKMTQEEAPSQASEKENTSKSEQEPFISEGDLDPSISPSGSTSTSSKAPEAAYEPIVRKNFVGDIHYMNQQFELRDLTIWSALGSVKIDLSKAMISEGETIIVIQAFIGEVNVYVPDDLTVAVQASSLAGELTVFHEKHSGINQQVSLAPSQYKQSKRRVKLVLSMALGEVTVRRI
ncbi:cell wall-active antibiotics response protein LiaF [Alkalihalophilus marmarensis]|uniref:Uncharacterized protein n=1 Tax=Alkalihalophilus marmarensis DSM 21297 TaxID=1188261 RepID=U6STL8_9BACI|nr:cell wall-active antibiotics response protein LiaF [Alkalihalophilus marmarensis]ERN54963.1 hypothetical protein A33I_03230 [Alkalihalophilus marmarensis DSM 21297]MCM3489398.1 cell wall-active antibiotics response protein LiaF [Alkalihalophilus marmarensis]